MLTFQYIISANRLLTALLGLKVIICSVHSQGLWCSV